MNTRSGASWSRRFANCSHLERGQSEWFGMVWMIDKRWQGWQDLFIFIYIFTYIYNIYVVEMIWKVVMDVIYVCIYTYFTLFEKICLCHFQIQPPLTSQKSKLGETAPSFTHHRVQQTTTTVKRPLGRQGKAMPRWCRWCDCRPRGIPWCIERCWALWRSSSCSVPWGFSGLRKFMSKLYPPW